MRAYNYIIKIPLVSDKRISEFPSKLNVCKQLYLLPHDNWLQV